MHSCCSRMHRSHGGLPGSPLLYLRWRRSCQQYAPGQSHFIGYFTETRRRPDMSYRRLPPTTLYSKGCWCWPLWRQAPALDGNRDVLSDQRLGVVVCSKSRKECVLLGLLTDRILICAVDSADRHGMFVCRVLTWRLCGSLPTRADGDCRESRARGPRRHGPNHCYRPS
jgi:hypothetical protein